MSLEVTDEMEYGTVAEAATLELPAAPERFHAPSRLHRIGIYALKGAALSAVFLAPAVAHGINTVEDEPPTHVPMKIAGSEVSVDINTGSNVNNVTAFGHTLTTPSHKHIGRKPVGYDVNVRTSDITKDNPDWSLNGQTVEQLLAEFSDPTAQKHEIMSAVRQDATEHFAKGFGEALGLGLAFAGIGLYARRRYKAYNTEGQLVIRDFMTPLKRAAYGTAAAVAAAPIVHLGYSYVSPNHQQTVNADPAFAGTPLAGAEIEGPFKSLIDAAVPNVRKFINNKNEFYDEAEASFKTAFKDKYGTDKLPKKDGVYRVIFEDDPQGIDGIQAVVGTAGKAYNADAILIGGDLNETGTSLETDVADNLYDHAGGIPIGASLGHHDDLATINIEKDHKFIVSNDQVQKVGPLAIYGINDAKRIDGLGLPAYEITPGVDDTVVTKKAIDYLCSDAVQKMSPKPIPLVHDRGIGDAIAQTGCAPTVLTGREYFNQDPIRYGDATTEFISGSTGGHGPNEGIHIWGPIKYPSTLYEIDLDKKTNRVLSYDVITTSNIAGAPVVIDPTVKYADIKQQPNADQYRFQAQADGAAKSVASSRLYNRAGNGRQSKTGSSAGGN
jgi:hypothetical protein